MRVPVSYADASAPGWTTLRLDDAHGCCVTGLLKATVEVYGEDYGGVNENPARHPAPTVILRSLHKIKNVKLRSP